MPAQTHTQPSTTDVNASGHTDPIWYLDSAAQPPLTGPVTSDESADVVVIGAGIAGLMTAYLLHREGRSVVVIDEKPIAGGESGRTSAHLASAIDDRFTEIERWHGEEGSRLQYESHAAAIDLIEAICKQEQIECDFQRLDAFLIPGGITHRGEALQKELAAAKRAGFKEVQQLGATPAKGFTGGPCLLFGDQARFHPLKFLLSLAQKLIDAGVRIFSGTRVTDLVGGNRVTIKTDAGQTITARAAVAATNVPTPINNWAGIYTKLSAYRTYMVGLAVPRGSVTDALFWDMEDPYHYVRLDSQPNDGDYDVLLTGGEDHKVGQHTSAEEQEKRFEALAEWTRKHFPGAGKLMYRWSGQVAEPDDGVAFIGKVPTSGMENVYVITGDSGMGLTHGTLGAMLITDLIVGKPNPWVELYDPARKPTKAMTEFLKENLNAGLQYVDYVSPGDVSSVEEIQPGHGAIVREGISRVACYKKPGGDVVKCSAVCTHLKGAVRWNETEKSWDCPVHGSRFTAEGKVIIGPALDDLEKA